MRNVLENEIEQEILMRLEIIPDSFVYKIAPGGFLKTFGNNERRMVKHRSRHIVRGVSDIHFHTKGLSFFFEVKSVKEWNFVQKHYQVIQQTPLDILQGKKKKHLKHQITFIDKMVKVGHTAAFVCSWDQVSAILHKKGVGLYR